MHFYHLNYVLKSAKHWFSSQDTYPSPVYRSDKWIENSPTYFNLSLSLQKMELFNLLAKKKKKTGKANRMS